MNVQKVKNQLYSVKNTEELKKLIEKVNLNNEEVIALIPPIPLFNPGFQLLTVVRTLSQVKCNGYKIIDAGDISTLQTEVTRSFSEGYIPTGGIRVDDNVWRQPVYKYENI